MTSAAKAVLIEPVVGERFDDWLQRWAESEGRALFANRAAAMHERLKRESDARKRTAALAIERVRSGNANGVVRGRLASWRQPGEFLGGAGLVNSVFALGEAAQVAKASGAVAERREGGETPLTDQQFRDTTWRAPWGPGYALHRPKTTS